MSEPKAPKIEFPLDYGIKVVANTQAGFEAQVIEIASRHDPKFDPATLVANPSSKGKYTAYNFRIWATGEPQLKALFEDFKATGEVHFVL